MGDISELRGLVTIVTFLGVLILILSLIPAQFAIGDIEGREVNVPDVFEAIDLYSFADYINFTLNNSTTPNMDTFILGNHRFYIFQEYGWIGMKHKLGQLGPFIWTVSQECYQDGIPKSTSHYFDNPLFTDVFSIQVSQLGNEIKEYNEARVTCIWRDKSTQEQCYIAYDETIYSDYFDAYNNDALWIMFAMNFDDVNTSYNAWDLVGMLLFFQLPETHWIINALIAIPLWVCIAYLCYVLIIKIIPFIAGG